MNGYQPSVGQNGTISFDTLLRSAHHQLGIAVHDRVVAGGGPLELRDSDLALDRMLAAAHRATGIAVDVRLGEPEEAIREERHSPIDQAVPAADHPLANRLASVRLKYRCEALRFARAYWPQDLFQTMRAALGIIEQLGVLSETGELDALGRASVAQLAELLAEVALLPQPWQRPAAPLGTDYLAAVEAFLEHHAEQLVYSVHNARQLVDDELMPFLAPSEDTAAHLFLDADIIAQDLADDLEQACGKARALGRAVAQVERISSDFVGEDLRHANLVGVPLEGVRWDSTTVWPEKWEDLIRRASTPADDEQGVLVVASNPHEIAVPADA